MRPKLCTLVAILCLVTAGLAFPVFASQTVTANQASKHIGETATVCGVVASTHFAASSRGRPTFINLDKPYPNQIFTIVIWGSNRAKFSRPESTYRGKDICVTGKIRVYRGVPEVFASSPAQIKVQHSRSR